MRKAGAVLAVLFAALAAAGLSHSGSLRPLALQEAASSGPLYGFPPAPGKPPRLAAIDPETMRAVPGRSVLIGKIGETAGAWSFSPDRRAVAVAVHAGQALPGRIQLVALPSLRRIPRTIPLGEGWAGPLVWVSRSALIGLVGGPPSRFFVADLARRRVVATQRLEGEVLAAERAGDRLVVLLSPNYRIDPVKLVVADATGTVRSVTLERVLGGYTHEDPPAIPEHRLPGLAVDVQGRRAFVFPDESSVAEIDLDRLAAGYHELSAHVSVLGRLGAWLQPSADAKIVRGPSRRARWLGDGLVALTGVDYDGGFDAAGQPYLRSNPAGLSIVDVRSWTVDTIDPGVTWAQPADELLLATGETMGLAAYDTDLRKRLHLFRGQQAFVKAAYDGRAYVRVGNQPSDTVVDLKTGALVGERFGDLPELLVD